MKKSTLWLCVGIFIPVASQAQFNAGIELAAIMTQKNEVRIPNDTGTQFDMTDLTGDRSQAVRTQLSYTKGPNMLRLTAAPLRQSGTGTLTQDTQFAGENFSADAATQGRYQFDTYRLTYRRTFDNASNWTLGAGGSLLVRDAEVTLSQGNTRATDTDLGVVPLLHLYAARPLGQGQIALDFEGAGASAGRAIDATVFYQQPLTNGLTGKVGYRVIEGGADVSQVYNFAWFNQAVIGLNYDF